MRSQANRSAASSGRGPDISAVGERDAIPMNVGEAKQFCLRGSVSRQNQNEREKNGKTPSAGENRFGKQESLLQRE